MSASWQRAAMVLGAVVPTFAAPLRSQLVLGATAGAVRYEQLPGTTSLEVNPDLVLKARRVLFELSGNATTASDGSGSAAGGGTLWGATPPVLGHLQFDGTVQGSYTKPASDSSSYSLLGFGEAAWAGEDFGVGVGAGGLRGYIAGQGALDAVRGSLRAWKDIDPVSLSVSIQPTRLSTGTWFTDYSTNAEWDPGKEEISGTVLVRQSVATGLDLGGEASLSHHFTRRVAFVVSAGRYLRDPFQGLPQGFHVNAGVALTLWSPHEQDEEGVGKGELTDLDLKALGLSVHSLGRSGIRTSPASSKKLTSSGGSGNSGFGRGHHL